MTDSHFTPNPARAIWIRGKIDQELLDRLLPRILELTSHSRDPITVFIESPGGFPHIGDRILESLRSLESGKSPCRVITVALSRVGSAAADLLSEGDFAIASDGCVLTYHGARWEGFQSATAELAARVRQGSEFWNERKMASLFRLFPERFAFTLSALRAEFDEHRARVKNPALADLECLEIVLPQRLSPGGKLVLERAIAHRHRLDALLTHFKKDRGKLARRKLTSIEDRVFEAAIVFERETQKSDPTRRLRTGGISRINDHFFLCFAYFACLFRSRLEKCGPSPYESFARLDPSERKAALQEANARLDPALPFLPFFVAVCCALNEEENCLSAPDAFLLGLVDAVWPRDRLAHVRLPNELQVR